MAEPLIFGSIEQGIVYTERRAVYAVILDAEGRFAAVQSGQKYFLLGGGSHIGETSADTLAREVREEVGRSVHVNRRIGEAVQYFYAASDACYFKAFASFFEADLGGHLPGPVEHDLCWLPVEQAGETLFHQSHAWAVERSVRQVGHCTAQHALHPTPHGAALHGFAGLSGLQPVGARLSRTVRRLTRDCAKDGFTAHDALLAL